MKEQDQIIAIAEACGWIVDDELEDGALMGTIETEIGKAWDMAPPYTSSLDAMAQAEPFLTEDEWGQYRINLACRFTDHPDDGYRFAISATAPQRAEAFLRAKKLWREGE